MKKNVIILLSTLLCSNCFFIGEVHNLEDAKQPLYEASKNLNAVLWMQTSAEYQMLCQQVFKDAYTHLKKGLKNSTWTAALEQIDHYETLPPAIIVDVDETILDNSPFQAKLIKERRYFSTQLWHKWVERAEAKPIPGAKHFIEKVKELGVKVFYVTNRELKTPTVVNLRQEIDPNITANEVFCKNEKPAWTSNKTSRRREIARSYRIILLVGDDYNDFTYLGKLSPQMRKEKAKLYADKWGEQWFILPNPSYGHFVDALQNYNHNKKTE